MTTPNETPSRAAREAAEAIVARHKYMTRYTGPPEGLAAIIDAAMANEREAADGMRDAVNRYVAAHRNAETLTEDGDEFAASEAGLMTALAVYRSARQ